MVKFCSRTKGQILKNQALHPLKTESDLNLQSMLKDKVRIVTKHLPSMVRITNKRTWSVDKTLDQIQIKWEWITKCCRTLEDLEVWWHRDKVCMANQTWSEAQLANNSNK